MKKSVICYKEWKNSINLLILINGLILTWKSYKITLSRKTWIISIHTNKNKNTRIMIIHTIKFFETGQYLNYDYSHYNSLELGKLENMTVHVKGEIRNDDDVWKN